MLMEAEKPKREQRRVVYWGTATEYAFCVSSVAMPSSSSYNLEVSSGALSFRCDVAVLKIVRKVGIEVKNTNMKAIMPTTVVGVGDGSMWDKEIGKESLEEERMSFYFEMFD